MPYGLCNKVKQNKYIMQHLRSNHKLTEYNRALQCTVDNPVGKPLLHDLYLERRP